MRRTMASACVLTLMLGGGWAQQTDPHANPHVPQVQQQTNVTKKKKHAASNKKQEAVAPAPPLPAQTMPPVPATLMNSTPVEPNVTMEQGLLTIDAPNSTLSAVLSGVQKATGAAIEGASPSERVAVRLGPGDPEQVIAALLRGTHYDYVILGSLGKPEVVTRVLLTVASGGNGGSDAAGHQPSRGGRPPQPQEEQPVADDTPQPQNNEPEQAQQPQPQPQPTPDESSHPEHQPRQAPHPQ